VPACPGLSRPGPACPELGCPRAWRVAAPCPSAPCASAPFPWVRRAATCESAPAEERAGCPPACAGAWVTLGRTESRACTAGAGEPPAVAATPAGAEVLADPPVVARVDGVVAGAGGKGGATAGARDGAAAVGAAVAATCVDAGVAGAAGAGAACVGAGRVGAGCVGAVCVGAVCVGAVCVGTTRAAGAIGAVGADAASATGVACAPCPVGLPDWAGVGSTPAGGRPVVAGCAARAARPSRPVVDVWTCCPARAAAAGALAGACAGGASPVAPELGPGSLWERTAKPGSADPALAGASSGAGAATRFSPSRSARRRTRSAWASSMLEEWLFTPMPIDRQRSRPSLLDRPSSRASS
jgi:hypothetical protein